MVFHLRSDKSPCYYFESFLQTKSLKILFNLEPVSLMHVCLKPYHDDLLLLVRAVYTNENINYHTAHTT